MKDDTPTQLKTKALIESCSTIKEIAKTRGVIQGTILNHLAYLKKEDSALDLSKFKPKNEKTEEIEKMILKLQQAKNAEDFSDDGRLRLRPIFNALEGQASYDEIRLVMLFV